MLQQQPYPQCVWHWHGVARRWSSVCDHLGYFVILTCCILRDRWLDYFGVRILDRSTSDPIIWPRKKFAGPTSKKYSGTRLFLNTFWSRESEQNGRGPGKSKLRKKRKKKKRRRTKISDNEQEKKEGGSNGSPSYP